MLKKKLSKKPNLICHINNNSTKNFSIKSLIKELPYQKTENFIKKIEISPSLESYTDLIKTSTLNNSISQKTNRISLYSKNNNISESTRVPSKKLIYSKKNLNTIQSSSFPKLKLNLMKNNNSSNKIILKKEKIKSLYERNKKKIEKENLLKAKIQKIKDRKFFLNKIKEDFIPILNITHRENLKQQKIIKQKLGLTLQNNVYLTKIFYPYCVNDLIEEYETKMKNSQNIRIKTLYNLEKNINNLQQITQLKKKEKLDKRPLREKLILTIISFYSHIKRTKQTIKQFHKNIKNNIYNPNEISRTEYLNFIGAIKENHYNIVENLIEKNPNLIYIKNEFEQTPLHIASKRERSNIINLLLENGAFINIKDSTGKTPLHYACMYNILNNVKILLFEFASPLIIDNDRKIPENYTNDIVIKFYLRRAKNIYEVNILRNNIEKSLRYIRFGILGILNISEADIYKFEGLEYDYLEKIISQKEKN